eukprot:g43274.t1
MSCPNGRIGPTGDGIVVYSYKKVVLGVLSIDSRPNEVSPRRPRHAEGLQCRCVLFGHGFWTLLAEELRSRGDGLVVLSLDPDNVLGTWVRILPQQM